MNITEFRETLQMLKFAPNAKVCAGGRAVQRSFECHISGSRPYAQERVSFQLGENPDATVQDLTELLDMLVQVVPDAEMLVAGHGVSASFRYVTTGAREYKQEEIHFDAGGEYDQA